MNLTRTSLLAIAASVACLSTSVAQTCNQTWTRTTATGGLVDTPFGPVPDAPLGFSASTWDHDGNPATPPHGLLGGTFTTLGGAPIRNIAVLAPGSTQWEPIGGGVDFGVSAAASASDGRLFVGGFGANILTLQLAPGLSVWDGTTWTDLPAPPPVDGGTTPVQPIETLAVDEQDRLIAGGAFASIGGVAANGIARWNGQSWSALGGGLAGGVRRVRSLGGGRYLAGVFTPSGGPAASSGLAEWTGQTWVPAFVGTNSTSASITDFAFSKSGQLHASGLFVFLADGTLDTVARWNGSDWERLGAGFDVNGGVVTRLAFLPDGDLTAGGFFTLQGQSGTTRVARFDGTGWAWLDQGLVTSASDQAGGLAALPTGELIAAGAFSAPSGSLPIAIDVVGVRRTSCPATVSSFGQSGTGTAGPNVLSGTPAWIGGSLELEAEGLAPSSLAVLLLGFQQQAVPLAALTPLGDPSSFLSVVPADSLTQFLGNDGGSASVALPLPENPALVGAQLFAQVAELGLAGSAIAGLSSTNGVALTLGSL